MIKKYQFVNIGGSVGVVCLLALLCCAINPSTLDNTSAMSEASDDILMSLGVDIKPTISIAIEQPQLAMEFTPNSTAKFDARSSKITISTNNTDGYKLMMSAVDKTSSALINSNQTGEIASITTDNTLAENFAANTWGYTFTSGEITLGEATRYNKVDSMLDLELANITTGSSNTDIADVYTLGFGAKVNTDIPAGKYSKEMIISAVTNPLKLCALADLTYMQDMRTEYCAQTPVEPADGSTKQLIDIRDGKKYWVTKLKDENCWMTQNLDYDITDQRIRSGSINPANTDISYTWNYDSEYPPRPTITNNDFGPEDYTNPNATYSWDVGEYMIADSATNATSCGTIPSGTQPINKNCNRLQPYDNNSENAHYLVGNYYQFNTLTAGSGDIGENQQSTSSICPKGWTLARNHGSGSYADLAKEYSAMLD